MDWNTLASALFGADHGIKQDGELRVAVALCGKSELATPARGLLVPGGGGGFEFA